MPAAFRLPGAAFHLSMTLATRPPESSCVLRFQRCVPPLDELTATATRIELRSAPSALRSTAAAFQHGELLLVCARELLAEQSSKRVVAIRRELLEAL